METASGSRFRTRLAPTTNIDFDGQAYLLETGASRVTTVAYTQEPTPFGSDLQRRYRFTVPNNTTPVAPAGGSKSSATLPASRPQAEWPAEGFSEASPRLQCRRSPPGAESFPYRTRSMPASYAPGCGTPPWKAESRASSLPTWRATPTEIARPAFRPSHIRRAVRPD